MPRQVNREFALLAACCIWPPSPRREDAIAEAAAGTIDWARFLRVARRHRVSGLVRHGLARAGIGMPAEVAHALKADAGRIARDGLALCAETIRLQNLFAAEGRPCAFVKGASLALIAYGDLGIRHAKDIDMIVPDADVPAACDLLVAAGYRRTRPPGALSAAQLALWRRHGKDMEWRHEANGIELELHWRLSDLSCLRAAPFDFAGVRRVAVMASAALATLPPAELFDYLCVHGASHGWVRLKWLADINALLAGDTADGIASRYARAREKGLDRVVGPALLLCRELFGLPLPAPLMAELSASWTMRLLAAIGRLAMTRGQAEIEPYDQPFGTTLINLSHLLMAGSPRDGLAELWRKSINLDDIRDFPLPRALGFLYPVMRWPLWAYRRVANAGASAAK